MGQSKSKERDFKKQKRSKVLKKDFGSKVFKEQEKRGKVKEEINRYKKQRGYCASPSEHPAHLAPTFSVYLSILCPFCISCRPQLGQEEQELMRKLATEGQTYVKDKKLSGVPTQCAC
jgi:hypothetical protein